METILVECLHAFFAAFVDGFFKETKKSQKPSRKSER